LIVWSFGCEGIAQSREGGLSMTGKLPTHSDDGLSRGSFLKSTSIATAATIVGMVPAWHLAYAGALTKAQREKLTPDDIKAAIDNAQLGNLTGLLAKIRPAVEATQYQGERSAQNYGFVDAVARKNVELTMIDIHRRSAVLAEMETAGAIKIAGAMYSLESGRVEFFA
jgi:hypothetical protein